jgi:hypothetical protein
LRKKVCFDFVFIKLKVEVVVAAVEVVVVDVISVDKTDILLAIVRLVAAEALRVAGVIGLF